MAELTLPVAGADPDRTGGEADRWRYHLWLLAGACAMLLVLTWRDLGGMVSAWARTGAFNHCFLIAPICGWLVWTRRRALALVSPEFSRAGLLLLLVAAMLWMAGEAGHLAVLRQAALVIAAQGLVVALLGWPVARGLAFPLGFALFLIPIGSELEPLLQGLTARMSVAMLHLAGITAMLQGVMIATPGGLFRVAEACSGVGFLLAMAAFSALVCLLCFRSARRRILFFATAMVLALLANALRAFIIMFVANRAGITHPVVTDHLVYGWILFALLTALLYWLASRWFDRAPGDHGIDPAILQGVVRRRRAGPMLAAVLALLLLPRLWMMMTDQKMVEPSPPPVEPVIAGWQRTGMAVSPEWSPHFTGATWIGRWRYADDAGHVADVAVILFDRQDEGREMIGYGQGATGIEGRSGWLAAGAAPRPEQGRGEWLRSTGGRPRYAATFYLVDGRVTGSAAVAKLASIWSRLRPGGHGRAATIILSADGATPDQAALSVARLLASAGSVQQIADRAAILR